MPSLHEPRHRQARIEPFTRPLFFAWSRISRGMTLGVRGVAIDADGQVLLVKHTYLHGWWLPGGGVDRASATSAQNRSLSTQSVGRLRR